MRRGHHLYNSSCVSHHKFGVQNAKMYCWGMNARSQLGFSGSSPNKPTEMSFCEELFEVVPRDIICGYTHTIFLLDDGTMYGWGNNQYGQLTLNTTNNNYNTPTKIDFRFLERVAMIKSGDNHNIALLENGDIFSWGYNGFGELGHGNTTNLTEPRLIPMENPIKSISCGANHTIVLDVKGFLWSWGCNQSGQLGYENQSLEPVKIEFEFPSNVIDICCGYNRTFALTECGKVFSWGYNQYGDLGLGHSRNISTPTFIEELVEINIVQITCGANHSLAMDEHGNIYSWGYNGYGQLGHGETLDRQKPHKIDFPFDSRVIAICCGYNYSSALTENGGIFAWGCNKNGELGVGDNIKRTRPTKLNSFTHDVGIDDREIDVLYRYDIHKLFLTGEFSDMKVEKDGYEFALHTCILKARCKQLLNPPNIEMISKESLEYLLTWIYSDSVDLEDSNLFAAVELLKISNDFGITGLKIIVENYLIELFDVNNIVTIINMAIELDIDYLKVWAIHFLSKNKAGVDDEILKQIPYQVLPEVINNLKETNIPEPTRNSVINSLQDDLLNLLKNDEGDYELRLKGGQTRKVHKAIVGARSHFFRALFQDNWREAQTDSCYHETDLPLNYFDLMLECIYGCKMSFTLGEAFWIKSYAPYYGIEYPYLMNYCEYKIKAPVTKDNAMEKFILSIKLDLPDLRIRAMKVIMENMNTLSIDILESYIEQYKAATRLETKLRNYSSNKSEMFVEQLKKLKEVRASLMNRLLALE
eukprot:TRINITY_DN8847_c0_g1_i1.p1 TRINITY_DN8847_c0_g1~~TRINITY_DN8847_c0_g1_i1.p1  ORF type:complete len:758 (+),score=135.46 TRINITY_DN8847_c0_g1_i1:1-2274(+)